MDSVFDKNNPQMTQKFLGYYVQNQKRIYGYILSVVSNWSDVEDILQDTTSLMWKKFDEFTEGTSFSGWGIQIAKYKVLEFRRKNRKEVDLGTEFSVLCQLNGGTEVYMYKGKANLFAGKKNANKTSELLEAGAGRKIDNKNCAVKKIVVEEHALVRNVDSSSNMLWKGQSVSLADIVGGGNGFKGGVKNMGVDVMTGDVISEILNADTLTGPKGYVAVGDNPYVDGLFVPGITGDTTQVSSDGTLVSQLPVTSGALWGYIFNGAMHKGTTTPEHNLKLNGTVFGKHGNPAINIHSNQGITFDLAMIGETVPGLKIKSFKSLIGISSTVQDAIASERGRLFEDFPEVEKVFKANCSKVDFWVFLDGKEVFHKQASSAEKASEINIPITAGSRFLTLAVTESDDTHGYDWALFGRPELKLDSAN